MVTTQNKLVTIVAMAAILLFIGCQPKTELKEQQNTVQQLKELESEIKALINSPIALAESSCKIITLKSADCEHAPKQLLYSTENTNEKALAPLVEQYNQLVMTQRNKDQLSCDVQPKLTAILDKDLCIPVEYATE